MSHKIFIVTQNKPNILSKITSLLRRKCFIVSSLKFQILSDKNQAEFEISIIDGEKCLSRIINQLEKVIEVISIKEL